MIKKEIKKNLLHEFVEKAQKTTNGYEVMEYLVTLCVTSSPNDVKMCKWLLDQGFNFPEYLLKNRENFLYRIVGRISDDNVDYIRALLPMGVIGKYETVKMKKNSYNGAFISNHLSYNKTPSIKVVQFFIDNGCAINVPVRGTHDPPLLVAVCEVKHNSLPFVQLLLKAGADPNNSYGRPDGVSTLTPLMAACKMRKVDVVTALLEAGARIPKVKKGEDCPLMHSMFSGWRDNTQHGKSERIFNILMKHGYDSSLLYRPVMEGRTPIHNIIRFRSIKSQASTLKKLYGKKRASSIVMSWSIDNQEDRYSELLSALS